MIALNEPLAARIKYPPGTKIPRSSRRELLLSWGARMWTVPKVLLGSSEHLLAIYQYEETEFVDDTKRYENIKAPRELAKRNFAAEAWEDPKLMRQLIDHFEGSLVLGPLELVTLGLECLQARLNQMKRNEYKLFSEGDMSYALLGLMRRRPAVDKNDSDFEAFAKLSLANDSNKLLERLICLLPLGNEDPWHRILDAWGVKLWDIARFLESPRTKLWFLMALTE